MIRILPGLTRKNAPREALNGVTLAAIAVPLNIGYAQIAGLPATAGLYALILPAIVFALIASTRQLIVSPDAAAAALVGSSLGGLAVAGGSEYIELALAQAIIGGAIFALCAVFRLGFIANFLSEPILIGFVGGLALDILISQIAKMLGVKVDSAADVIPRVEQLIAGIGTTNIYAVLIALISIAILVPGRRFLPTVPWALVVLIISTVSLVLFGLADKGVSVLGKVDAGPPSFTFPTISLAQWGQLVPSALALTLVAIAEGLLVARRFAEKNGYTVNANRDLAAFAGANVASGLTGGFTVGSSASRTAAMDSSGARTQLPTIVAALLTLLLVIFGTALLANIPSPAIGAIVAVAVVPLLGIFDFPRLWRLSRFEFTIAAVCFLCALLLGPIIGVFVAFILSLVNVVRRAATPPVDVLAPDDTPRGTLHSATADTTLSAPGVIVLRFAGPLFFANAGVFHDEVQRVVRAGLPDGAKHLVLDFEAITDIDVTAASRVEETLAWAHDNGVDVSVSRMRTSVADRFAHFGLLTDAERFASNHEAIEKLRSS